MKRIFQLSLLLLSFHIQAQTLFTYGNHKVSASEFLNAFHKNNTLADTDENAMRDYLDLYIAFKLKVQDAKDQRIDTLPSLKADLQSFRHQLEKSYLYDKSQLQELTDQALDRVKKDIHVSTVVLQPDTLTDTPDLAKMALDAARALQEGKDSNLDRLSEKGARISRDDMGFITVFSLPYEIENIIYGLKPGEFSEPFHFDDGYYIFKNEGERAAAGKIKLAQILISAAPDDDISWEKAGRLADSLYRLLKDGGEFAELAREFSNDRNTYFNGGEMPEFGVGKYSPEFEKYAFSLKKDQEISKPFKTAYGYHILKRISATPVPQDDDAGLEYAVKNELLQDNRVGLAREKLLSDAAKKTGFHDNQLPVKDVYKVTDSSLQANQDISSGKVNSHSVLFDFNDGSVVTMNEWDQFLRNSGRLNRAQLHQSYDQLWPGFVSFSILENYQRRLEEFDNDFAQQMSEFGDGNMLFEMMQRKVWMRASNDSTGLETYYRQHRDQYKWPGSADAVIFWCNSEETALKCINELRSFSWRKVMEKNAVAVQADSGRYEITQLPLKETSINTGIARPVVNQFDGTASFADVLKVYPENMQRSFEDARGLVTEDYQKVLEQEWVKELKAKYPVTIDKKVWNKIKQSRYPESWPELKD